MKILRENGEKVRARVCVVINLVIFLFDLVCVCVCVCVCGVTVCVSVFKCFGLITAFVVSGTLGKIEILSLHCTYTVNTPLVSLLSTYKGRGRGGPD